MKRIFTLVVLAVAMMATVQAQGVKFGVKGGLNITKMSVSKDVIDADNQTGFYVGPTLKISLPAGFGVDIAALYDQRSAKLQTGPSASVLQPYQEEPYQTFESYGVSEEKVTQKSINIPVNLRYNIGLGGAAGIYLAAGPQFGFPVGDKVYNTNFGEYRLKDANLSINFGAGVYLLKHLEVGFTYNLAAGKSGEFSSYKDVDTHNNAWQIGAAVYF